MTRATTIIRPALTTSNKGGYTAPPILLLQGPELFTRIYSWSLLYTSFVIKSSFLACKHIVKS